MSVLVVSMSTDVRSDMLPDHNCDYLMGILCRSSREIGFLSIYEQPVRVTLHFL
jgi:hypothetical protein